MAIDWSGYDTFGKGLSQAIGGFADLAGLSGKAQSLAQLRATLNGQEAPQTPFQKLGDLLKGAVSGKGLDGRGVAQQTLGSLTAPQTPATVPAGPGASLSPQDMSTLTQRYGGGTAPLGAVTRGRDLAPADNFEQRFSAGDPNALKPMTLTPQTAQTAKADISPAAAYIAANKGGPDPSLVKADQIVKNIEGGGNGGLDIAKASQAIKNIESSGGDYQAVGPVTTYKDGRKDRPFGAYQVMGANVGPWTRQYYGQELTPQQFLASPEAQEAVFKGEFSRLAAQFGPNGAAQAWLGGPGSVGKTGRQDILGTSVGEYGQRFAKDYSGAGGGGTQVASSAVPQDGVDATAAIPSASGATAQDFGTNIPTQALVSLLTNQYLPAEDKNIVMALLQTRMPQAKQFGFQIGPDGTMYRTNATTGEATAVGSGGVKPTSDQQEYAAAKQQGYQGTLQDWIVGNKKAGATNVSIDNTGQNQFSKDLGAGAAKMFTGMMEAGPAAQQDTANIGVLRDALSKAPTGLAGGIQSIAQDWGLNLGKNADSVQVVKAVLARLTPAQRVPGAGTTSDRDLAMFQNALPKLTGTPGGNALILDTMQAMAEYKQAQADIATRLATGEFKTDVDPTGMKGAVAALRALPDPMAAFKAKGQDVVAGKPYQSSNAAPGGQQPVPVKTPEEAAKLPSGTPILLPDGTTGVVP